MSEEETREAQIREELQEPLDDIVRALLLRFEVDAERDEVKQRQVKVLTIMDIQERVAELSRLSEETEELSSRVTSTERLFGMAVEKFHDALERIKRSG